MLDDVRQAARGLVRSPLLPLTGVGSLGAGLGAAIAVFAALDVAWFAPLPLAEPSRLVTIWSSVSRHDPRPVDYLPAERAAAIVREPPSALAGITAYGLISTAVVAPQREVEAEGAAVTDGFFAVLGNRPRLGRAPAANEAGAAVVVLSDFLWRSGFGSDPGVLGRTLDLFGEPYTVIGVLRRGAEYPRGTAYWIPARSVPASLTPVAWLGIGRLAGGASPVMARQQFIARAGAELGPDSTRWGGQGLAAVPIAEFPRRIADPRLVLAGAGILAAVLVVLLNLANLMAVRVLRRGAESAVRAALGGSRWATVRPFFAEVLVMAGAGVALAALVAGWGVTVLARLDPDLAGIGPNARVLAFAAAAVLVCVAALGVPPAVQLAALDLRALQHRGGAGLTRGLRGRRVRDVLIGTQVALALVLVIALGVLLKALGNFRELDVGYDAGSAVVVRPEWPVTSEDREQRATVERVAAELGSRGYGRAAFWRTRAPDWPPPPVSELFAVEGRTEELPSRIALWSFDEVSAGFFATIAMPVLAGRPFTRADDAASPPVVIVSRAAAEAWWPGESALGKRIRIGPPSGAEPWLRVVGVVADAQGIHAMGRTFTATGRVQPRAFRPIAQAGEDPPAGWAYRRCFFCSRMAMVLRPDGEPRAFAERLGHDLASIAPELGATPVRTLLDEQMAAWGPANLASGSRLLAPFALLAVGLSLLGIVGVVADGVTRRTREVGIRMALGARRSHVVAAVARESLWTTLLGTAAGVAFTVLGASITGRLFYLGAYRASLPGTGPRDLAVVVPAALLVLAAAALVSGLAARRAARVNPAIALRAD